MLANNFIPPYKLKEFFLFFKMILDFLDFLKNFDEAYHFISKLDYALSILGSVFILYAVFIFLISTVSLFRTKNLDTLKAIHILSITEVYAFVCGVIGVILISNIYNILLFKILLFLILVIFNAVTVTRLIAKTGYFYNLKVATKSHQSKGE